MPMFLFLILSLAMCQPAAAAVELPVEQQLVELELAVEHRDDTVEELHTAADRLLELVEGHVAEVLPGLALELETGDNADEPLEESPGDTACLPEFEHPED